VGLTGVGVDVDKYRRYDITCQDDDQWPEHSQLDGKFVSEEKRHEEERDGGQLKSYGETR
jgi:hypothetical protein